MKKWYYILIFSIFLSCKKDETLLPLSVYYWKTNYNITEKEQYFLRENQVEKIYIRYCDVGLVDNQPIPIAPIEWENKTFFPKQIVPVIYIKNEVFLKEDLDIRDLVQKLKGYIAQINQKINIQPKDIQFDCDWSLESKNKYFKFLEEYKKQTNQYLSATIRLHQVKYFEKTGVPPVDHGVLMFYNMGNIISETENSIYNKKTAQKYTARIKEYPLHLDVALPIFSWGVHFRNNKVERVIGGLREKEIQKIPLFEKNKKGNYQAIEDYNYQGRLILKNDEIKIEEISEKDLTEITKELSKKMKQKPREIIIYDLNQRNLENYEKEIFYTIRQGY